MYVCVCVSKLKHRERKTVSYYYNHLNTYNHITIPFPYCYTPPHNQNTCLGHLENHIWVLSVAMSPGECLLHATNKYKKCQPHFQKNNPMSRKYAKN